MLAMQYSITLPADYDMAVIRARIASKGHLLDGFPQLAFKAFAYAGRGGAHDPDTDNVYAPFYLWDGGDGMNRFLCGDGFAALCRDFGRPRVRLWTVLAARTTSALGASRWATRATMPLYRDADLRTVAATELDAALQAGASAAVTAFDPSDWTLVRFTLWRDRPAVRPAHECQIYEVGYVAQPGEARK
jgi:hypothetical protein